MKRRAKQVTSEGAKVAADLMPPLVDELAPIASRVSPRNYAHASAGVYRKLKARQRQRYAKI